MICSLFNFCPWSAQSRRHGGALVGLVPPNKAPSPQVETWNTIKSVEILSIFRMSSLSHKHKAPYWKHSSGGSESAAYSSFVRKKPNLTQMKQEFKYLCALWHGQLKVLVGSKCLILGEQQYFVW